MLFSRAGARRETMKVQTKILLLLLGIGGIFVAGLIFIKYREYVQFQRIARERAIDRRRFLDEALERFSEPLDMLAKNSTYWDDMVRAINTGDTRAGQDWLNRNINDNTVFDISWEVSGAHVIWIFRLDHSPVFNASRPYAYGDLHDVAFPAGMFDALDQKRTLPFFISTPKGIMEIRAATVHPSTDSYRQTPPQGYFLAGRLWSDKVIGELARDSNNADSKNEVRLDVADGTSVADETEVNAQDGVFTFSHPLLGWDGKPVARLVIRNESAIIKELNLFSRHLLLWLVLFSLVLILLLYVSLMRWVKEPLALISDTLRTENPAPLERLRDSHTEFGVLAKLIREFFEQRASLLAEVHERKNAQEALRVSGEQLRQAQKMEAVGRLAGGVAHDFNNLLTAILGYAELLGSRKELDPTSRQNVAMIQKAGRQAAAVTHQLLAFSRKQVLQPRVIDLNTLVVDFEKILRRVIGESIELKTRPKAANGRVKADPNQIEQVVLNLGVNARDAMLPRGGRLTIRTANVVLDAQAAARQAPDLTAGSYVVLEVSDTGHGMSEEVKSRIFEPFFTTKGLGKGTGLGLATVYGITKQSGGAISVESAPGAGCCFRVYLPEEQGQIEEVRVQTVAPIEHQAAAAETVLVVEDEEIVRDLVCHVLSEQGYNVLCASNGVEALEISRKHGGEIRLVITDVVMPQIGGLELARKLVVLRPGIKVLYVSGYSENDMNEQGIAPGELEFLEKPFTPQALTRKVRDVMKPFAGSDTVVPGRAGDSTVGGASVKVAERAATAGGR